MSCHTDGSFAQTISRFGGRSGSNHCECRQPGDADRAKVLIYEVYPPLEYDNANIDEKPRNAVMYPSVIQDTNSGRGGNPSYYNPYANFDLNSTAVCGKDIKAAGSANIIFDYRPDALSFNTMESDTWFCYVFDMGPDGGTVGTPCYRIETQTRSGTPAGQTVPPGGTATTTEETSTRCIPCANFYCTPTSSSCSYTAPGGDETGDPDAPYPLLFGVGTASQKVVFRYDALSTTLPNGVVDINFVYAPDGIDQDVWDQQNYSGDPIITSQTPWIVGEDDQFETIIIYEGSVFESGNKQDLKVKVKITPVIDFTQSPAVVTGTSWELMELMQPGLNYAVNDTFTLSYTHLHNNGSTSTISIDLKITAIGPYSAVGSQPGFDILRAGDTINGHIITETFHTDIENFQYHVLYLDGLGNDFAKDASYTSDRNHVITVVAGLGIPDRASLIGLYEFMEKSIQFSTYSVDPTAPDVYNTVVQPDITANLANGTIDSVTINDGGAGWDTVGQRLLLAVHPPLVESGKQAVVEGVFTGGVLTEVNILSKGSGYSTSEPPQIWVRNQYGTVTEEISPGMTKEAGEVDAYLDNLRDSGHFNDLLQDPDYIEANQKRLDQYEPITQTRVTNNGEFITDPDQDTRLQLPQRLYSKAKVDRLKETYDEYKFPSPKDAPLSEDFRQMRSDLEENVNSQLDTHFDSLTQKKVPDFASYPATKIETTMRRFVELPKASTYTKYLINQYRADPQRETSISITLSCNVAESGCDHMYDPTANPPVNLCPPPAGSAATTNDEEETYEDENGVEQTETVTYSYSYTLSPMLGPGCDNWSASGSMTILNNLTKATNTYAAAVEAYGNPFDV